MIDLDPSGAAAGVWLTTPPVQIEGALQFP